MERKDITILYVDDEPINLTVFELNFKRKYKIVTAESGHEGLKKLDDNNEIIIVISDMRMPEMDGLEFINIAKTKYKHVGYFILTGFEITQEISLALSENLIHKYFKKPFDNNEIENAIEEFVANI